MKLSPRGAQKAVISPLRDDCSGRSSNNKQPTVCAASDLLQPWHQTQLPDRDAANHESREQQRPGVGVTGRHEGASGRISRSKGHIELLAKVPICFLGQHGDVRLINMQTVRCPLVAGRSDVNLSHYPPGVAKEATFCFGFRLFYEHSLSK